MELGEYGEATNNTNLIETIAIAFNICNKEKTIRACKWSSAIY